MYFVKSHDVIFVCVIAFCYDCYGLYVMDIWRKEKEVFRLPRMF